MGTKVFDKAKEYKSSFEKYLEDNALYSEPARTIRAMADLHLELCQFDYAHGLIEAARIVQDWLDLEKGE